MDSNLWKNLCDAVKSNIALKEMAFEKSVASTFLSALGWNVLIGNLKEQYVTGHTNWKTDFALFVPGNDKPEIIVELKKPLNKQNKKNLQQVSDYLKITDCRFVLYFGERLELFMLADMADGSRELKSVMTVEYEKDSPYYKDLLSLLHFSTYKRENMMNYCMEQLAIKEAWQYWQSDEGSAKLLKLMMKHSKLKPELLERFQSTMDVQVKVKNHALSSVINPNKVETKKKTSAPVDNHPLSKPRFQFWMAGLKKGDSIVFEPTGKVVKVASVNKIEYQGKQYSLSAFCTSFMPEDQKHSAGSYEGPSYFTYKGRTLKEIRNEKEKEDNQT